MNLSRSTLQRLKLLTSVVIASAAAGALYSVLRTPPDASQGAQAASGAIIGAAISSCITGFELFAAGPLFERGGHRLPLLVAVLLRTIVYGVAIMAALLIIPWVFLGRDPSPVGSPGTELEFAL